MQANTGREEGTTFLQETFLLLLSHVSKSQQPTTFGYSLERIRKRKDYNISVFEERKVSRCVKSVEFCGIQIQGDTGIERVSRTLMPQRPFFTHEIMWLLHRTRKHAEALWLKGGTGAGCCTCRELAQAPGRTC